MDPHISINNTLMMMKITLPLKNLDLLSQRMRIVRDPPKYIRKISIQSKMSNLRSVSISQTNFL